MSNHTSHSIALKFAEKFQRSYPETAIHVLMEELRSDIDELVQQRDEHIKPFGLTSGFAKSYEDEYYKQFPKPRVREVELYRCTNNECQIEQTIDPQLCIHCDSEIKPTISTNQDEVWEALLRLCELKKYKDEMGKDSFYLKNQPEAWKQADEALNSKKH